MLDIYTIPVDDEETWNLIGEGKTKGIFQLETSLGQTWCKKIRPRNIDQLAAVISLIRPGCLKAMSGDGENRKSMTQRYADRNRGEEEITYLHKALEPILNQNLGIQIFQEDSIKIAQEIAGFNLQEADLLRKCIAEGCIIYTNSGPYKIEDLASRQTTLPKILTVDKNGKLVYKKIKDVWSSGKQRVYRLSTQNGCYIELTKKHKVFTQDGWKPLEQITKEDFVIIPNNYTYKGNSRTNITEADAILLAYLISERCHRKSGTKITNANKWILDVIRKNCKKANVVYKEYYHKNGCVDIYIHGQYRDWLRKTIEYNKSRYKTIPESIANGMNGNATVFVAHYFNGDGCVNKTAATFYSTSKNIIDVLQALLLRNNIHSSISQKNSTYLGKPYVSYCLNICGRYNIRLFLNTYHKHICPQKKNKLKKMLINMNQQTYANERFLVPVCFMQAATQDINVNCVFGIPNFHGNRNWTYDTARRLNNYIDSPLLTDILNFEYKFVKVKDIKYIGFKETYDYTVDDRDTHYGFINQILVANSIGKKDAAMMSKLESQFIEGCVKTGKVDRVVAEEIFSWTRESQKYSFNRSHAVSYAMNGYRTAYLKSHYPVQFFAAWLLGSQWKSDPQRAVHEMVNDARNFGIIVNPPSLLFANPTTHIHNNQIYFGVGEVNGIGKAGLVKTRKVINEWEEKLSKPLEKFSPSQFIIGIANNINNTVAEALIWSGAVDWLRMSRTSLIFYLQQYKKLSKGEKVWCENNVVDDYIATLKSCGRLKKEGGGIHSKNRLSTFASIVDALENPPHSLEDNRYKIITKEKQYLGISLTLSQSDMYHLQKHGNTNCGELNEGVEGNNLLLPCTIVEVSTTITRKGNDVGKEMAFINVEDGFGVLDGIIAFAQSWQNCKDSLYVGNNVVMRLRSGRDCYFLESVYTEDAL